MLQRIQELEDQCQAQGSFTAQLQAKDEVIHAIQQKLNSQEVCLLHELYLAFSTELHWLLRHDHLNGLASFTVSHHLC